MKTYLDDPVVINDVEIRHTREGLIYLIDHYEHILTYHSKKLDEKALKHIKEWLIPNLQYHLKLYNDPNEILNPQQNGNTNN
jgi:hypothetical protein